MARIVAPVTTGLTLSTAYLGAGSELWICGAKRLQIGAYLDGTGLVECTIKVQWGGGQSVQITIPASNLWTLDAPYGEELPQVQLDAKATSGTPELVIVAV